MIWLTVCGVVPGVAGDLADVPSLAEPASRPAGFIGLAGLAPGLLTAAWLAGGAEAPLPPFAAGETALGLACIFAAGVIVLVAV